MTTLTYLAAGIMAVGVFRAYRNTPNAMGETPLPETAIGGPYSTGTGVSLGNSMQYVRDDSKIVWSGRDVYGVPAQDVEEPDGSRRRVYGNWSKMI